MKYLSVSIISVEEKCSMPAMIIVIRSITRTAQTYMHTEDRILLCTCDSAMICFVQPSRPSVTHCQPLCRFYEAWLTESEGFSAHKNLCVN